MFFSNGFTSVYLFPMDAKLKVILNYDSCQVVQTECAHTKIKT